MRKEKSLFKYDELTNKVMEQSIGFTKSRVLLTAYELDIFSILGDTSKTSDEVAQILNGNRQGVERLMNALVALNLLEKIGRAYKNTKAGYSLLVKGNPHYMANLKYMTYIWNNWENLTESVLKGTSLNPLLPKDFEHEQLVDYLAAENWLANLHIPEILKICKFQNIERILDLGCGSGALGLEIVKQHPEVNLTLFDYPNVIGNTEEYVNKKGLDTKVQLIGGDIFTDEYGKGYDLIILSHVLRNYSVLDNMNVLRKVFDALTRDGKVLIHEYLLDESRDKPEYASMLSLDMLVSTENGDMLTETDIWLLLKEAMFSNIERELTDFGSYLIIGHK